MSNPTYSTFSSEVRGSDALTQLALDLNWSWNHSADEIWKYLDPELWQLPANPWLTCGAGLLSWQDDIAGRWKDVRVGPLLVRTEAGRKHNRYRSVSRRPGSECRASRTVCGFAGRRRPIPAGDASQRTAFGQLRIVQVLDERPNTHPPADFTPRILPCHSLALPHEVSRMLWQK